MLPVFYGIGADRLISAGGARQFSFSALDRNFPTNFFQFLSVLLFDAASDEPWSCIYLLPWGPMISESPWHAWNRG
jgi:hypothetical protein